jgi:hypothetical protein
MAGGAKSKGAADSFISSGARASRRLPRPTNHQGTAGDGGGAQEGAGPPQEGKEGAAGFKLARMRREMEPRALDVVGWTGCSPPHRWCQQHHHRRS